MRREQILSYLNTSPWCSLLQIQESRGGYSRRIDSDSEEEEDDLDGFIDDSDAKIDIGKEIRSIFG